MDPLMINRVGQIQHQEFVAWAEKHNNQPRRWTLQSLFAMVRQPASSPAQSTAAVEHKPTHDKRKSTTETLITSA